MNHSSRREIGNTGIEISPVAMGCWPIAGMTSLNVTHQASLATLQAALESGVNHFDTAFCYGPEGESERLIAEAFAEKRDQVVLATKGGIHWDENLKRQVDGRPATLRRELETSLQRLNTDRIDLYYLHGPDPEVPIADSAAELTRMREEGKVRAVGASNCTIEQLEHFHAVCPLDAYQPPYNMLQRGIEADLIPWCQQRNVAVISYWPLMKGLLAGRLARDHQFPPEDGRAKYPMFQGDQWQKNQDYLDELRSIADEAGRTVAQVTVNWTIHQPGITAALCGAKRPEQIEETAVAMSWRLSDEHHQRIAEALTRRGEPVTRWAV